MMILKIAGIVAFSALTLYSISGFVAWYLIVEFETEMHEKQEREPEVNELKSLEDFQPLF